MFKRIIISILLITQHANAASWFCWDAGYTINRNLITFCAPFCSAGSSCWKQTEVTCFQYWNRPEHYESMLCSAKASECNLLRGFYLKHDRYIEVNSICFEAK